MPLPKKTYTFFLVSLLVVITTVLSVIYLSSHLPTPVQAGHKDTGGREGWYCADEHTIWHDLPIPEGVPNPDDYHAFWEDCGGDQQCKSIAVDPSTNYSQDAECRKREDGKTEAKGNGTKMYAKPTSIQVNQQITFGFSADKSCVDKVNVENFKIAPRLEDCKITEEWKGCDEKDVTKTVPDFDPVTGKQTGTHQETHKEPCGPADWADGNVWDKENDKQFTKTFVCTGRILGNLNAPLRTDDENCNNNVFYSITAAPVGDDPRADCREETGVTPTADQGEHSIVANSIDDDNQLTVTSSFLRLPKSVNQPADSLLSQTADQLMPTTDVKAGFLQLLASPFCGTILQRIGIIDGLCLKNVNTAKQKTKFQEAKVTTLANAERSQQIEDKPQISSCNIKDVNKTTEGDKTIDKIQTSLSGKSGTAIWNDLVPVECPKDQTINLNTDGRVFAADDRVPEINADQNCYSKANYPPGIVIGDSGQVAGTSIQKEP